MANINRAFIINWFGTDDKIKSARRKYHTNQIDWLVEKGLDATIFPQEYEQSDYDVRVKYIEHSYNHVLFPGEARNELLNIFYDSDEDYAIFADSDSILWNDDKHLDSKDFIDIFNNIPMKELSDIDLIVPVAPNEEPFNSFWNDNRELVANNLVFERKPCIKGSLFILKNLNKHYRTKLFFDTENFAKIENDQRKMIAGEDNDFSLNLLKNGFGSYVCRNIVLKEFASLNNSTWSNNNISNYGKPREIWSRKYGLSERGYKEIYKTNFKPKKVIVPKDSNTIWNSLFD